MRASCNLMFFVLAFILPLVYTFQPTVKFNTAAKFGVRRSCIKPIFAEEGDKKSAESDFPSSFESATDGTANTVVNLGKGGEKMEAKWTDPAMIANSNPLNMSWGWIFIIWPTIIIANDFLHFLPEDGLFKNFFT